MKIIVTPHTITLNKTEIVNEGEYNINTCYFQFSEEYQGLSSVAVFTNGTDTYSQTISNNQCIIPSEVLQNEGTLMVGVYGYEVEGDNLIKRYSPTPVSFYVEQGSYTIAEEPTPPSPSIVEQLQAQITENANNITTLDGLVSVNTQAIENINQELPSFAKKTEIPTKTSELTNDSGFITDGDIPSKTSQLENDSGFITKSVNDLENYTKTSDLTDYVKNTDYATLSTGGVIKTSWNYGTRVTDGLLNAQSITYNDYQNLSGRAIIGKDTLENVITGKGLVSNTDYAENAKGGVIKAGAYYGLLMQSNGSLSSQVLSYSDYNSKANQSFISKGTLENVLNARIGDINTALDTINGEVI